MAMLPTVGVGSGGRLGEGVWGCVGGGLGVGGGGRCNNVLSHAFRGLCFSLLVTTVLMLRCENSPVRSMTLLTLRCACTRHALLMLRCESSLVRFTTRLMLRCRSSLVCSMTLLMLRCESSLVRSTKLLMLR